MASDTIRTRDPMLIPSQALAWPPVVAPEAVNARGLCWPGGGRGASEGATDT